MEGGRERERGRERWGEGGRGRERAGERGREREWNTKVVVIIPKGVGVT